MNRHEGVSCDACLKGNFRGRRYKCLLCYDYDLCALCYEQSATTTRHNPDHPMQCIIPRSEYELYYAGENVDTPQSYTCPYCGRMGFTEATLQEHVSTEHTETFDVICPVCAAMIGGDPNMATDDLASHLAVEHRTGGSNTNNGARDLISFLDEPVATVMPSNATSRHTIRRSGHTPRGVTGTRGRRSNMHFNASGGLSSLSPSARDTVDPIAELLSQLSGVRRSAGSALSTSTTHAPNNPTQLQQIQMQLQLERQQAARQQLERLPRRPMTTAGTSLQSASGLGGFTASNSSVGPVSVAVSGGNVGTSSTVIGLGTAFTSKHMNATIHDNNNSSLSNHQFLLSSNNDKLLSEEQLEENERFRADRGEFVREILLATIAEVSRDNENKNLKKNEEKTENKENSIESENLSEELSELSIDGCASPMLPSRAPRGRSKLHQEQKTHDGSPASSAEITHRTKTSSSSNSKPNHQTKKTNSPAQR